MNEKRIELEIGYLKLLLTIVATMFAGITSFLGMNFNTVQFSFLTLLLMIDLLLVVLAIIFMTKIENLLNAL
jgi:hypothetical protein